MRFRELCAIGVFCAATGLPTGAGALTVTLEECNEGADFIRNAAFSRDNGGNIYGSTFFMATGFHGFHVIVGTIFLIVCLIRTYKGHFTPRQHFGFEAAAWYWHFVDVVWLFLFIAVYVWGGWGAPVHSG
jgi:heme/copper-type cytochrome/quinol oxidase subunit 3